MIPRCREFYACTKLVTLRPSNSSVGYVLRLCLRITILFRYWTAIRMPISRFDDLIPCSFSSSIQGSQLQQGVCKLCEKSNLHVEAQGDHVNDKRGIAPPLPTREKGGHVSSDRNGAGKCELGPSMMRNGGDGSGSKTFRGKDGSVRASAQIDVQHIRVKDGPGQGLEVR